MADWKAIVRTVAPALASVLGTPLLGTAVAALGEAVLGNSKASITEVATAVATGSPEVLLKIKEADAALQQRLAELGVDIERISAEDRDSARKREIETKDSTPTVLAYMFVGLYFGVIWAVWKYPVDPNVNDLLMILIGTLTGALIQILNYYFGSSSGSAQKSNVLAKIARE